MGAFRRGEVQTNNKLWMTYGDLFIKMPRKNLVSLIEKEQKTLVDQIEKVRFELKEKTQLLLKIQPTLTDMDPYVVKLLLQQNQINQKKNNKEVGSSDEDVDELELD